MFAYALPSMHYIALQKSGSVFEFQFIVIHFCSAIVQFIYFKSCTKLCIEFCTAIMLQI